MDPVLLQAVKDLLHEVVDKEEGPVLADLLAKLPPQYAAVAQPLVAALLPQAVAAEDALIDKI